MKRSAARKANGVGSMTGSARPPSLRGTPRKSAVGSLRQEKPDGIDFVGNSKVSSFCKNPRPSSPIPYIWYHHTYTDRRRAAFRRAESSSRVKACAKYDCPCRQGGEEESTGAPTI